MYRTALACALLVAMLAEPAHAQTASGTASRSGVPEVRRAFASSVAAWNRGDLEAHVAIYADSGTGGPPFGPGGRARARAFLGRYFTASRPALRVDSLDVRPLGAGYVLATGRYRLTRRGAEEAGWFTEIWQQTARGWRIVHEHSTSE